MSNEKAGTKQVRLYDNVHARLVQIKECSAMKVSLAMLANAAIEAGIEQVAATCARKGPEKPKVAVTTATAEKL